MDKYKKSLIALAFGTFGLGMAEFAMMAILPLLAADFGVSIPEAGRLISLYALGVCAGAPAVAVFARKWPLKRILLMLAGIYITAAMAMALCPVAGPSGARWPFYLMLAFRFMGGIPHGAYFSVSAIVADRLAPKGKSSFAIAIVSSGMAVANLVGIPLATWLTTVMSWRPVFGFNALIGVATLLAIITWIPRMEALPDHGLRGEFRFLRKLAPWLMVLCTAMGNGGVFCWYSYVSPTLTQLGGIPERWMTAMMVLAGAGMLCGSLSGGKLSDRFGPGHTGLGIETGIFCTLVTISLTCHITAFAIPTLFICTACLFAVSAPQQLLLIRHSQGGELLGGAMVQIAFNLGNAVGAYLGGLPINESDAFTYHYPAAIGAGMALIGIISYYIFCRKYERR